MQMDEYVSQIAFMLGFPSNSNIEQASIEQAVLIAFREMKRYMDTPVDKTVSYSQRIDLKEVGIETVKVLYVFAAYPKVGLAMSTIESGNVFQVAAAVNTYGNVSNSSLLNIDPIVKNLAYAQVRNCLTTDFQWKYDLPNQVVYCTHRDPVPAYVTIRYVPIFHDVSEITNQAYIDYIMRLGLANMKISLGRSRSKYRIEGSNVQMDGETLLQEGNAEVEAIRAELGANQTKLVILN